MKRKSKFNVRLLIICLAFFCFAILIYRVGFLSLSKEIDGINIKSFADNRSVVSKSISSKRGNIYDVNGNHLAMNVSSYTLIAYLDPSRSEDSDKLYHVEDKKMTAEKLATVIDMKEEDIYDILNQEGLYQVEFGYAGRGLTQIQKEAIEALNLPGLDFIEDEKRYYPNGAFASYTLGYAKNDEDGKIVGEFGMEELLDEVLSGNDGYTSYQVDVNGYKIAGTKEYTIDAQDGDDVYLTIDSNIQLFVEQALSNASKKYKFDWMTMVIADAKTGAILGLAQTPTYDPNTKDISNWYDYTVSYPYEPGSIMKIYTYMAAMEAGTYIGDATFLSGLYTTSDGTKIYDWDRGGFGEITFDQGFTASSNVGVINIVNRFIDRETLYDYFTKMGFGKKTGITLGNEAKGYMNFKYETEVYNAAFGQGITTTPMQHIQALTSIANDGVMLRPYIVSKVVDESGEVLYEGKREELATVASKETTDKIRNLMYDTVNGSNWYITGGMYKMDGYDLIGKTGTAQLVDDTTGRYFTTDYYTTKSFVGMWPKDDPDIIIYTSVNIGGSSYPLRDSVKSVVENVSKYLNIFDKSSEKIIKNFEVDNYFNKDSEKVISLLKENNVRYVLLGNGNRIIDQYPLKGNLIDNNDFVILKTNSSYSMPDINKFSKKQVENICDMLNLNCNYEGYGYVKNYSIKEGTLLKGNEELKVVFE